jgi:hypothetical protein
MSVLFIGCLPEDFGGGATATTNTTFFDATYTDKAVACANNVSMGVPYPSPTGKVHIHYECYTCSGWASSGTDGFWFTARDGIGGTALWRLDFLNGDLTIITYGTGGSTGSYTLSLAANARYTFDFTEEVVSGVRTINAYVNGALVLTNSSSDSTRATYLDFAHNDMTNGVNYYSEFYITDNDQVTIGTRLALLAGDGAGNYTDGTGTFANLDTVGASGLELDATEQYSYTLANLPVSPTAISSVVAKVRGVPSASVTQVNPFLRISATDYADGNSAVDTDGIIAEWAANPATAGAWTETAVNALEFGLTAVA